MLLSALCVTTWAQAPPAADLVAQAQTEASRLRDLAQSAIALADVAMAWRKLGDPRWEKTWAQALQAAEGIREPVAAPLAWRGLALRLWPVAPEQAQGMFNRSITLAAALPYAAQKALALREIGRALLGHDDALARTTFEQAAAAARAIDAPIFRAAALRDLAVAMAPTDHAAAAKLFTEAAGLLPPADPDDSVQLARSEIVVAWGAFDVEAALPEADLIGDPPLREATYRRMCEALAPVSPDRAMQVMAHIHDGAQRALAMASLAAGLAASQPETAAGMARAALAGADRVQPADREVLQAEAAVALAPSALSDALALLQQVDDEKLAGEAFRHIVVWLAASKPAEALKLLEGVEDWQAREAALMDILPQVAQCDPTRAAALANELLSRAQRIRALLMLAEVQTK